MAKTRKTLKLWLTALFVYLISTSLTFLIEHWEEKTSELNPVHIFFRDFDFSDIYYKTKFDKHPAVSIEEITIVNMMGADRGRIAALIEAINTQKPAVIGIDCFFEADAITHKDSVDTDSLKHIIERSQNLVLGFRLPEGKLAPGFNESMLPGTEINIAKNKAGFLNISDVERSIRSVPLKDTSSGAVFEAFGMAVVKKYFDTDDNPGIRELEKRDAQTFRIAYQPKDAFNTINGDSVAANPGSFAKDLKDKIVLLGESEDDGNAIAVLDKHFTPLNPQLGGRSLPDMEGIYIKANVINTLLNPNRHFYETGSFLVLLLSLLACLPLTTLLMIVYCRPHHIYHFFMVLVYEPAIYFGFIFLSVFFYSKFIYVPLKTPYILLTISPFVLYLIDLADIWLNRLLKKFTGKGSPTYFSLRRIDHFHNPKKRS